MARHVAAGIPLTVAGVVVVARTTRADVAAAEEAPRERRYRLAIGPWYSIMLRPQLQQPRPYITPVIPMLHRVYRPRQR